MNRRMVIVAVAFGLLSAPLVAEAQRAGKVARVGLLLGVDPGLPQGRALLDPLRQGLRERGYVEGQNIVIEYRWGGFERYRELAAELAGLKVDLLVVGSTTAALAAKQATNTTPIVAAVMADPVKDGLAASLAQPGGNVTGLTFLAPELVPKRLELLREAIPTISRVAALWHRGAYGERTMREMVKQAEGAARALGAHLDLVGVGSPDDFDGAFSTMARRRADAFILLPSPMLFTERRRIVDIAARYRLPAMYQAREFVEIGGLMAYGANIPDLFRRAAIYVDRIIRGAKPADLPVEQASKFEFVINSRTAKALGLTIPPSILVRADQVIE